MPERRSSAKVPPRWVVRVAWIVHRRLYALTRGRFGLRRPGPGRWGMVRLHTTGRRSGRERVAIVAYLEEGPDLVLMAMNGWSDPLPAWWLNLRAHPEAVVDLPGRERRDVTAREALGEERSRLWEHWRKVGGGDLDAYAARRTSTPLIVLEPTPQHGAAARSGRPGT